MHNQVQVPMEDLKVGKAHVTVPLRLASGSSLLPREFSLRNENNTTIFRSTTAPIFFRRRKLVYYEDCFFRKGIRQMDKLSARVYPTVLSFTVVEDSSSNSPMKGNWRFHQRRWLTTLRYQFLLPAIENTAWNRYPLQLFSLMARHSRWTMTRDRECWC